MRRIAGFVAASAAATMALAGVSAAAPENGARTFQLPIDCGTDGQFLATVLANGAVVAWAEGEHFVARQFDPDVHVTITVGGESVSFHDEAPRNTGAQGAANNHDLLTCTFVVNDDFTEPLSRREARQLGFDESLVGQPARTVATGTVTVLAARTGG